MDSIVFGLLVVSEKDTKQKICLVVQIQGKIAFEVDNYQIIR